MTKRVLFTGAHLWNQHWVSSGLVFEQGTYNESPILWHVVPGQQPRTVARLPVGRPRGVLRAVEDARMICLEGDGTLSAIDLRGRRTVIRRLTPNPAAIAITPEQVVWAVSDTRNLEGGSGPRSAGQVWRWWRGTDDVELLGEQPSFRPDLAVGGVAGADEMASPIYIAADHELGVIETHGMRWLARSGQPIGHLVGAADAVIYASDGDILRRSHKSGLTEVIHRETIPMGLAVHDHRLVVTCNSVIDRRQVVETSALGVVDLRGGPARVLAIDIARPGSLAAGDGGIALVEGALDYGGTDRLVLIDWDTEPVGRVEPLPELDDAIWQYPFSIQWWHPSGNGGYLSLDRQGDWQLPGDRGRVGLDTLRRLEAWRREWRHAGGAYVDLSINRGWLVTWGLDAWFRAADPDDSPQSRAVAAARDLVASLCPAFADIVRTMP